jgi:hypothetical protein
MDTIQPALNKIKYYTFTSNIKMYYRRDLLQE